MAGIGGRALERDVFFYDRREPSAVLGGLVLNPGMTNANVYSMIGIILVIPDAFSIQDERGEKLPQNSEPLLPGNYYVVSAGTIRISDEAVMTRAESLSTGIRVQDFRDLVRRRDGRCVITKQVNRRAIAGNWLGFHAAHIFPLAYERFWNDNNFSRWISLEPSQGGRINSVQNGLLLRKDVHAWFDAFDISINPDVSLYPPLL
jgi:hypothetical protein